MDVIIVCHTEFGFVDDKTIIYDKNHKEGVSSGVINLIKLADKYGAKITFAVMPEVVDYFPKGINHEIGLHIHPGWKENTSYKKFTWFMGDIYLKEHCKQSSSSVALRDFSYQEQLGMIRAGKERIKEVLGKDVKVSVAGKLSENSDTIRALDETGISHDCSACGGSKNKDIDWSRLSRICMPYHPDRDDYQKEGSLPILIVPISKCFPKGEANPEMAPVIGLPWLKACFSEYYNQGVPLFHIFLHSPYMTDNYFSSVLDNFLSFISKHKNINFKFASEIKKYEVRGFKTNITPYLFGFNKKLARTLFKKIF